LDGVCPQLIRQISSQPTATLICLSVIFFPGFSTHNNLTTAQQNEHNKQANAIFAGILYLSNQGILKINFHLRKFTRSEPQRPDQEQKGI
jgi:hypothetical protein